MEWDFDELFDRYFDKNKAGVMYSNCDEHMEDKLRALDLLLELYTGVHLIDGAGTSSDPHLPFAEQSTLTLISAEPPAQNESWETEVRAFTSELFAHVSSREKASAPGSLPLLKLRESLRLSEFSEFCAVTAAACHFSRKYERIFASFQGGEKLPTVGLCLALYNLRTEIEFSEIERVFYNSSGAGRLLFRLSALSEKSGDSVLSRALTAQPAFYRILKGSCGTGDAFSPVRRSPNEPELPALIGLGEIAEQLKHIISNALAARKKLIVHIHGTEGCGKLLLLRHAVQEQKIPLFWADYRILAALKPQEAQEVLCNLVLNVVASGGLPVIRYFDFPDDTRVKAGEMLAFIAHYCPLTLVTSETAGVSAGTGESELLSLAVPPATVSERRELWGRFFADSPHQDLTSFANRYGYSAGQIERIYRLSRASANVSGHEKIAETDVLAAIEQQNSLIAPSTKLTRVACVFTWDDLVLPQEQTSLMREACNRVKYAHVVSDDWGFSKKLPYGNGISVLLFGSPGTGKTMSAQVIAGELKVPLFKVDLSQLVSKYIGETEKNLAEIFEFGRKSNCVLFFDEADSLFGKRTEVKDSLDKHANTETAFLLQKIEEHSGISILSTNLLGNIDAAFRRRFTYIISIPKPDAEMRLRLWRGAFPAGVPISGEANFERMAEKLDLTGSSIKSIALEAAYAAAASGTAVLKKHLVSAVKNDLTKNGRVLSQSDLLELF